MLGDNKVAEMAVGLVEWLVVSNVWWVRRKVVNSVVMLDCTAVGALVDLKVEMLDMKKVYYMVVVTVAKMVK